MSRKELIEKIADNIDALINIDFTARGVIQKLYSHARRREGRSPMLASAEGLKDALSEPGRTVIITTGFYGGFELRGVPFVVGETDGPPGAVALARTLTQALRAVPVLVTENEAIQALSATARAAGLFVTDLEKARKNVLKAKAGTTAVVRGFPWNSELALKEATATVEEFDPYAVVAIEKMGPNEQGIVHSSSGTRLPDQIRVDYIIEDARRRGAFTIGIGDGGNEMGMALIKEGIAKDVPYGGKCRCPCGGGPMWPAVETDVLVTANVSNWGAYGISACLLALLEKPDLLYSEELELTVLRKAAEGGYIDASSGFCEPAADGLPVDVHISVVKLISTIVKKGLIGWPG